jgi:hypothetical protein
MPARFSPIETKKPKIPIPNDAQTHAARPRSIGDA